MRSDPVTRTCGQCAHLSIAGICLSQLSGLRGARTPPNEPRECLGYTPKPPAYDDRTGRDLWPWLVSKNDLGFGTEPRRTAHRVILDSLKDGPRPAIEVITRGTAAGVGRRSMQSIATRLGVRKQKYGFGGPWHWSLNNDPPGKPADSTAPKVHKLHKGSTQIRMGSALSKVPYDFGPVRAALTQSDARKARLSPFVSAPDAIDVRTLQRGGIVAPGTNRLVLGERPVELSWTSFARGAQRAWFLCPHCTKRVAVVFRGRNGTVACRHCLGLAYRSQRESHFDRAITRARNLRRDLGWSDSLFDPPGPKPAYMRWKRYFELVKTYNAASSRALGLLAASFTRRA